MIRYYLLVALFSICKITCAQDIYGSSASPASSNQVIEFRKYSIHNAGEDVVLPLVILTQNGSSMGNESTTDLTNHIYFYLGRPATVFMDSNVIHIIDVVNKTHLIDTFGGDSIRHIEYNDDTLWGLYENGISFYEIKTGKIYVYDSIHDGREKGHEFFHWVMCTAFDHENMVYMFTKRGEWTGGLPDTFLYYDIRKRQLTKKLIPGGFFYFDYSTQDKAVYMPYNGLRAADRPNDSVSGLYKYDPYTNVLNLHIKIDNKTWQGRKGFADMTIDPYRNRMFFVLNSSVNTRDTIGMLRINNHRFEKYKTTKSNMWQKIEFLNTYNDTTVDPPLSVNEIAVTEHEILCYPNPTSGMLYIDAGVAEVEVVRIIDISGKNVLTKNLVEPNNKIEFDISSIPEGHYILKVTTSKGVLTRRFVIER